MATEEEPLRVDSHPNPEGTDVPYLEESTDTWARSVAEAFRYRSIGDAWEYYGDCPRCHHPTSMIIEPTVVMRGLTVWRRGPDPVTIPVLTVACSCEPGHKQGFSGCGAYGDLFDVAFE